MLPFPKDILYIHVVGMYKNQGKNTMIMYENQGKISLNMYKNQG